MRSVEPVSAVLDERAIDDQILRLNPIGLIELDESASLLTRVDRKYVLTDLELTSLLEAVSHRVAVLEIDRSREFTYESIYFDTPGLDFFRSAAHGRRQRFKVRTRGYLDAGTAMLEVKSKGLRGETVKVRQPHDNHTRNVLDPEAIRFVEEVTGIACLGEVLAPTLTSFYRRVTLVDLDDVARLTIDRGLRCELAQGGGLSLHDSAIVETKSSGSPSFADRWLWAHGRRPEKLSKYGTSLAALNRNLPSNKWHRTIERHFAG